MRRLKIFNLFFTGRGLEEINRMRFMREEAAE